MNYFLFLIQLFFLYSVLGYSLGLVVGYSGLLSLGHAAFFGTGAYIHALLSVAGWSFPMAALSAMLGGGVLALSAAIIAKKLRGDHFAVATLGLQFVVHSIFVNWVGVTGGPFGIRSIPPPNFFSLDITGRAGAACLLGIGWVLCVMCCRRLILSPFGRTLRAIRDNEVAAISLGKSVQYFRLQNLLISGVLAAFGGSLYVSIVTYIDPSSFTLDQGILMLTVVVVGGSGSLVGPIVGGAIVVIVPEVLRFVRVAPGADANVQQIAFGLILLLVLGLRPRGLVGDYDFSREDEPWMN